MKIIFMGTPKFAVPTLKSLIDDDEIEVIAVYTKEPKIAGRGHKIQNSEIHNLALEYNLPIFCPKNLKSDEIKQEFINLKADFSVVVAYGLILPKQIIEGTKFACLNIHPSLLPKWRGAAPVERSIMSGDKKTAISIIKMDENLDSGDIVSTKEVEIDNKIHCKEFLEFLSKEGSNILIKTLKNIYSDNYELITQDHLRATYAEKIKKSEFVLDFNQDVDKVYNKIRALNACGSTYFIMNDERIKIHEAELVAKDADQDLENVFVISAKDFKINCKNGMIRPLILQRSGKGRISLQEFLNQIN
jgi:methionyl-tRNA formyltransferase